MLGAIKYNLANLTNFNGRDARQTFWYYVLLIIVARFAASMAVSIPMMAGAIGSAVSAAQQGSDPAAAQAQMMSQMSEFMPRMMWFALAVGVITALLLVASFVRRLHDSDLSGWWAALPFALHAYALSQVPAQMDKAIALMNSISTSATPPNPMTMMQGQGLMALVTYLPLIIGVILAVRKSSEGANRFGDNPVSF